MPSFDYECRECKKRMSILRTVAEYDKKPTRDEENEVMDEVDASSCPSHHWVKVYLGAPMKMTGPSWGPGKGYW